MLQAYVTSAIRTGVPALVGWLVGWLIARGINVPAETRDWVVGGLTFAALLGYYLVVRAVELKFPQAGWLLGVAKKPVYGDQSAVPVAAAPYVGEHTAPGRDRDTAA